KADRPRVRAGRQQEIVFQLPLVAIADQVHAGIKTLYLGLAKDGNVRPPLGRIVAQEVIDLPRQLARAADPGLGISPHPLPMDGARMDCSIANPFSDLVVSAGAWRVSPDQSGGGFSCAQPEGAV